MTPTARPSTSPQLSARWTPRRRTARVDVTAKYNGQTVLGRARATVQLS